MPDLQPTLEGPRVTVRPITKDDWSGLFAAASDPLVWEQHPATDRYKEDQFRTFLMTPSNPAAPLPSKTASLVV